MDDSICSVIHLEEMSQGLKTKGLQRIFRRDKATLYEGRGVQRAGGPLYSPQARGPFLPTRPPVQLDS